MSDIYNPVGQELVTAQQYLQRCLELSAQSPCCRDKRGVVIVHDGVILGEGVNGPPRGFECSEEYCGDSCRVTAVHAEMRAIINAGARGNRVEGAVMYHARVEGGKIIPSRQPRCADCSKHIVEAGLAAFVLQHEKEGITVYSANEFHRRSLEGWNARGLSV